MWSVKTVCTPTASVHFMMHTDFVLNVFATMRHVLLADPAIMPLQYPTKLTGGFYVMSTI